MRTLRLICFAAALAAGTTTAQATTFFVDAANSSVALTETGSGLICDITNCGVSATLAAGLNGTTFDLDNVGDSNSFDFLTFTGTGTGAVSYDVTATLAFDPPSFSTSSGGSGGALLFFGSILAGILNWDDVPALVVLDDGSEVTVDFEGGTGFFLGNTITTSASVTLEKVAAVPLPASALMLLLGLGGLAGVSRIRKKAA